MKKSVFPKITYADDNLDPDMALAKIMRAQVSFFWSPSVKKNPLLNFRFIIQI